MTAPPLRLLQITDCHIYADASARLAGVDTRATLLQVVDALRQHLPADALLLTGDLTQENEPEAYAWLLAQLAPLALPIYCLPGNHDEPATLTRVMARLASSAPVKVAPASIELGAWSLLLLDTTVPEQSHGHLSAAALDELRQALAAARGEHLLIAMHHHPVPVGSVRMDGMMLDNAAELLSLLAAETRPVTVVFGHVHQAFEQQVQGIRVLGTPATSIQFLPDAAEFAFDSASAGYRLLTLHADGRLETEVKRLA